MTCFGINYKVAGNSLLCQPEYRRTISRSNRLDSMSFQNLAGKSPVASLSTSETGMATGISVSDRGGLSPAEFNGEDYKFDEWIQNSVTEIVKNIRQAPLLVQIYADGGVVKTDTAVTAADWPEIVRNTPAVSPDGIILVEELQEDVEGSGSKEFGVLIQGKMKGGRDTRCKSACYLLKTCSVNGGVGLGGGNFCTHFCLMKVNSFGKSVSSQFNDCWLLQ